MKKLLSALVVILFSTAMMAQTTVTGTVTDEQSGEPIPGVNIKIAGTNVGTSADFDGNFTLSVNDNPPFTIEISIIGYATSNVEITQDNQVVTVALTETATALDEVVVSASRTPERIMESPVTIERMDARAIKNTSSPTFYDGLQNLKGVDINTNSLTNKSVNTRGFATFSNERFIQLVDGMDNSSPALNFALGNLLGMSELDVYTVEILPGAASALYGPNAFNGALFMTSKNPFDFQGFSMYGKTGITSSKNAGDNNFVDAGFRGAYAFSDKFAAKVSFSYLNGTEWYATDYRDYDHNNSAVGDPTTILPETGQTSFDRLNIYGDEVQVALPFRDIAIGAGIPPAVADALGLTTETISRTGYREEDLTDYDATSIKADMSLHYRPMGDDLEIIYNGKIGKGNTIYQGANRYNIKNFILQQHKLEIKNDNFVVRAYLTAEDAGDSYDMRFTGINMNRETAPLWYGTYAETYLGAITGQIPGVPAGNSGVAHSVARQNSDAVATPQPGSAAFKTLFDKVTSDPDLITGSKFVDETKLYNIDGNYNFSHLIDWAEIQVGGSWREYSLNSGGTIFTDYDGPINYDEYGMYTQIQKRFADEKLKFTGSIRYDKSQNFDGSFSPRLSLVYTASEDGNHNFRASFQTGFRNPTTQDQYIGLDAGQALLVGSAPDNLDRYTSAPIPTSATAQAIGFPAAISLTGRDGYENSWSLGSIQAFGAAVAGGTPVSEAIALLQSGEVSYVKPEQVTAFEVGYRGILGKISVDFSAYYNVYEDFIGQKTVVAPLYGEANLSDITPLPPQLGGPQPTALIALSSGDVKPFSLYTNSAADISSYGVGIGLNTKVWESYQVGLSYTWSKFDFDQASDPDYEAGFNTPEHQVKVAFGNPNAFKNFGFNVNLRWNNEYLWQSTFADAIIDAKTVVDAQINYRLPKWKSTFKAGAANLFGEEYFSAPGNGTIGSQYFVSWTLDI